MSTDELIQDGDQYSQQIISKIFDALTEVKEPVAVADFVRAVLSWVERPIALDVDTILGILELLSSQEFVRMDSLKAKAPLVYGLTELGIEARDTFTSVRQSLASP